MLDIETLMYIAFFVFFGGIALIGVLAHMVFEDDDPELLWYDEYAVIECPHLDLTDVVEEAFADYELVGTYCFDCGERLSVRQDGY